MLVTPPPLGCPYSLSSPDRSQEAGHSPHPLASVLVPALGDTGAGTPARVSEVPWVLCDSTDAQQVTDQACGLLPSRVLSPHNTTRLRPAAHPTQSLWNPQRNPLRPGKSVLRVKRVLPPSFHAGVSGRLLWEMVLHSWLCLLCLPKALSSEGQPPRSLWVTASSQGVDSYSLALEVTDGRGRVQQHSGHHLRRT